MFNYLFQPPMIYLILALVLAMMLPIVLSQIRAWKRQQNFGFDLVATVSIRSMEARRRFTKIDGGTTSVMTSYDIPEEIREYISIQKGRQRIWFIYTDNNEPVCTHHISNDCSITVGKHSMRIKDFELGVGRPTTEYLLMLNREFERLEHAMGRPIRHDHYMLIRQIIAEDLKRSSTHKSAENGLLGHKKMCG